MNIGFDLDRVFIDTPPFIPYWVIDKFYKEKDNGVLLYRMPRKFEQIVRKALHASVFRPAIKENIDAVKMFAKKNNENLVLISSRFGFLHDQTEKIMNQYHLTSIFPHQFFNEKDEQPHLFKNRLIREKKIDVFIDDDLSLLRYISKQNPDKHFYWLNKSQTGKILPNLSAVTSLHSFFSYVTN